MRMYDLIRKKRDGLALTGPEIGFFVDGYVRGEIPDYQVSALLMAVCLRGMDQQETALLTGCMARSGEMADLSSVPGIKVDKHSTGGVGDKTTLVCAPIAAACGVPVAKMSGRGLGHTGGTVDKLESIPGLRTAVGREEFLRMVRENGIALIGQSGNIAPADKKIYALRDVTATVESLPLIASSIMSKKLAAGSDAILLDVKTGSGAFLKTLEGSVALAQEMVEIGVRNGRRMAALVTDMDTPLGHAVGNALEVAESVAVLKGHGPADLTELCLLLAAEMLVLAGKGSLETCRKLAGDAVSTGRAFEKLRVMAMAQGGDVSVLDDPGRFPKAPVIQEVRAARDGWVTRIQTEQCGIASVVLGAGRERKEDPIDPSAGLMLVKKVGDRVQQGETLAWMHTACPEKLPEAEVLLAGAYELGEAPPPPHKLVYARITADGVELL